MTSNTLLSKLKSKIIIALIIVGLLCASLFFLSACGEETAETDEPTYTYTDTDDGLISNPNFNYNTSGIELENFPQTSPTGWSRSKDSDGNSSSAKSGVVDISPDGWNELLNSIYNDTYYVQYLESALNFSKSDEEQKLKDDKEDITAEELKTEIVKNYISKLTAPKLRQDATDNKVYMLNNYTSRIGYGASQKITSSKSITINKGEFVEISVWVLTQNIKVDDNTTLTMSGANPEFGASIRLTNTLNGSSQSEYVIANIDTKGEWQKYTLYVKGDANFDCTATLSLGLGYSDLYPTQGTVYFDDISVVEKETVDSLPANETKLIYGEKDAKVIPAGNEKSFYYDMTLSTKYRDESTTPATEKDYFESIELIKTTTENANGVYGNYTKSNNGQTSLDKFSNSNATFEITNKVAKIKDIVSSSYTLNINDDAFMVKPEEYVYVSFKLNNNLNKLSNTTITVDVWEKYDSNISDKTLDPANTQYKKTPAVATISETGETTVSLVIKNNFDSKDTSIYKDDYRFFYISIVVGPTNISTAEKISDFANGDIEISELKIATGKTYQYERDASGEATDTEIPSYKFYQLYNGIANGSTSLYAGNEADYSQTTEDSSASTGFGISATDRDYLKARAVAPSDYDGVGYDHIYLNKDSTNSNINDRVEGTTNIAGVIDTQYLDSYANTTLKTDLMNFFNTSKDKIRPLMIYNGTPDSYGFISNQSAQVIAANSYSKISVKVKVSGENAKAYIYLVDTTTKDVMTFDTFTPNSNGISSEQGKEITGKEFKFVVDDTNEEWVDVVFYIATGKTQKSFRLELWNGSRDGENKSEGFVFFDSVSITSNFTEPTSFKESFTNSSSPLYKRENDFIDGEGNKLYYCYYRKLTDTEKEFNQEYPDDAISYPHKIVWAENEDTIYAIFNNIDVEEIDPYESINEEETTDEDDSGCAAERDPATFWLSFSSILLAAVLVLAILALFVRNIRRKRKARASDAKSHYTVTSRVRKAPKKNVVKEEIEDTIDEEVIDQPEVEETELEEVVEEPTDSEEENKEQTLDEYVYGEVQDFGEDSENK